MTSGPDQWDQEMLHQLSREVEDYFRAYYAELRSLVAEYEDSADLPRWFRGGRQIETSVCTDGVAIGHTPHDPDTRTFPEREDEYRFYTGAFDNGYSVSEQVRERYNPLFPDGSRLKVMPEYEPGEDFGPFVRLWPAYFSARHPLARTFPLCPSGPDSTPQA